MNPDATRQPSSAPPRPGGKTIAFSVNASWNVINFRAGLIRGLQEAGHEVIVMAPVDEYSSRVRDLGVRFEPIPLDAKGLSPWRDLYLLWSYWRLFKKHHVDVYMAYTVKPNVYGSLAAHLRGIPVVNNVAGLGAVYLRNSLLTRFVSLLYKIAFSRSSTVFFQNQDDRSLFVARRLVRPERAKLLPGSGVDLARFAPSEPTQARRGFTFLLTARMLWEKGVGEFVEAARALRPEHPDARFQLLGFVDLPGRNAISRRVVDEWVAEGLVEYLGETDDVRPFVHAADCVVLPSRYPEGVPRSLLEAAAMAKPLIATDAPGCRDIVQDGVNGLLCGAGSSESLTRVMAEMLASSEARRREMGRAGRELVERRFSEDIVVREYLAAVASA